MSCSFSLKTALFAMLLGAMASAMGEDLPDHFSRLVPLTLSGEGPWYRLELPLSVQLSARQGNLNDIRVFNADGQAQPYALTLGEPQRAADEKPVTVKWFPLYSSDASRDTEPTIRVRRSASGTLVEVQPQSEIEVGEEVLRGWLLDTSAIDTPLDQLIIDWSTDREGFQRFSIEASDDLQHWQPWGEGQVARLSFADEVVEQREVALPSRTARYVRLLWHSPQSAPQLTAAQLLSTRPGIPPLSWSPPLAGTTEKPGVYVWQLPVGMPLERMKIDIAQPNSLAPATVYGRRDANQPWRMIDSALFYRLTQNGQDVVRDELELPGLEIRQLKMEVDDRGGGLGTEAPALRFAVRMTQLVFLARGAPPYSLALGNPDVTSASLPLATLVPGANPRKLAELGNATLSLPEAAARELPPPVAVAAGPDWKRLGLWGVLVVGVLVLGAMALSTLRASRGSRR